MADAERKDLGEILLDLGPTLLGEERENAIQIEWSTIATECQTVRNAVDGVVEHAVAACRIMLEGYYHGRGPHECVPLEGWQWEALQEAARAKCYAQMGQGLMSCETEKKLFDWREGLMSDILKRAAEGEADGRPKTAAAGPTTGEGRAAAGEATATASSAGEAGPETAVKIYLVTGMIETTGVGESTDDVIHSALEKHRPAGGPEDWPKATFQLPGCHVIATCEGVEWSDLAKKHREGAGVKE